MGGVRGIIGGLLVGLGEVHIDLMLLNMLLRFNEVFERSEYFWKPKCNEVSVKFPERSESATWLSTAGEA